MPSMKKIVYRAILTAVLGLTFVNTAEAALYTQTISTYNETAGTSIGTGVFQHLGTGLDGTVESYQVKGSDIFSFYFYEGTTDNTMADMGLSMTTSYNATTKIYTITPNTPIDLDPTKYYGMIFGMPAGSKIYGNSASSTGRFLECYPAPSGTPFDPSLLT